LVQEGTNSGRPPRSGIVITHRRPRENWQQREDRYRCQQEDYRQEEERRGQDWNRHRDHWNCPFFIHCWEENIKLPTVRDCPECNGYDRYDRIDRRYHDDNRRFDVPIRGRASVHDRLAAGSACTIGLAIVSNIFPETRKSSRRWLMREFPMSSYFARMLTRFGWSQGRTDAR